jgi:hypothetical protein
MSWRDVKLYSQEVDVKLLYAKSALVFNLFGDHRATPYGNVLLDRWTRLVGERPIYYLDKHGRTYKLLSATSRARVHQQLEDPIANGGYSFFHFKDSKGLEVGDCALELFVGTTPKSTGPNRVFAALPLEWLDSKLDDIVSEFIAWVDEVPLRHGTATIGFDVGFGSEYEHDVRPSMMALARRYLGMDVRTRLLETKLLHKVKGPGWLTYLRADLFDELGGEARLRSKEFSRIQALALRQGVLLKSGERPPIGDLNRGADDIEILKLIDRFIRPVRVTEFVDSASFGIDEVQGAAWLARFER